LFGFSTLNKKKLTRKHSPVVDTSMQTTIIYLAAPDNKQQGDMQSHTETTTTMCGQQAIRVDLRVCIDL
jgi:hypothetical protein